MTSGSFFIQRPEDALRHVNLLAKGLKKVAQAGLVGGAGCTILALMLTRFLVPAGSVANPIPGAHEISGIVFVSWFMAIALLAFSGLYFVSSIGLAQQKSWGRYTAAGTFLGKVVLCMWLGRGSIASMIVFLVVAGWDIYGLWVLLSKETGHLFMTPQTNQVSAKPADLAT